MSDDYPETIVVPAAPGYSRLAMVTPEDETPLRQPIIAWRVKREPNQFEGAGVDPVVPMRDSRVLTSATLGPDGEIQVRVQAYDPNEGRSQCEVMRFRCEAEWLDYARPAAAHKLAQRAKEKCEAETRKKQEREEANRYRARFGVPPL